MILAYDAVIPGQLVYEKFYKTRRVHREFLGLPETTLRRGNELFISLAKLTHVATTTTSGCKYVFS